MLERLKLVRKNSGLNQTDFGNKIGMSQSGYGQIENGNRSLNDRLIKLICIEFNINEDWLRTGEGDMTLPLSREEEIMQFIGQVQGANNAVAKKILSLMAKLDHSDWLTIDKILDILVADTKKEGSSN